MTYGEWFLGSATLALALGAFLSIWLNYRIQVKERKARLLNDIIDWAREGLSVFPRYYGLLRPFEDQVVNDLTDRLYCQRNYIRKIVKDCRITKDFPTKLQEAVAEAEADITNFWNGKSKNELADFKKTATDCAASFGFLLEVAYETRSELKL